MSIPEIARRGAAVTRASYRPRPFLRRLCLSAALSAAVVGGASTLPVGLGCSRSGLPPAAVPLPPGLSGTSGVGGHVRFHGRAPADVERPSKLAFPECSRFGPPDASLRLSPEGGVMDAFVWIKAGLPAGKYPVPEAPVLLDQKGCEFKPRVFGVRVGQDLVISNSDPFLHNTHALSGGFNVPLPREGETATRHFERSIVPAVIGCDVHGWMRAYAGVVTHPFFAVTNEAGAFEIPGLPAGHYTVEAWHERLGRETADLDVAAGEKVKLEIEMKPPG